MKRNYAYILLFLLFAYSCNRDNGISPTPGETSTTFSLTESEENKISSIDVLAFRVDDNNNTIEYFAYRTQGRNIVDDGAPSKKKFTVNLLRAGNTKFRFVVIANAKSAIDAIGEISTVEQKADVLNKIIVAHPAKWLTNIKDLNYTDIPMWCETAQILVSDNTTNITGLSLLRMLSRVDVVVDVPAQSVFKLKSVRVYNYNTIGNVVPSADAINQNGIKVDQPTIPENSGKNLGPLLYNQLTTNDIAIVRDIYLFETAALGADQREQATCLVIGGEYNNEGNETFYRIDFATKNDGTVNYLDILRNHLYNIKITAVKGSGYNTFDEAFNAQAANITADVTVWESGGLSEVIFDGQYMLGVSSSNFVLPRNQRASFHTDNKLTITTDYPEGWQIESITDINGDFLPVSWLTVSQYVGWANSKTTISLVADENYTEVDRTAYIHIKAGRLTHTITIKQTTESEILLLSQDGEGNNINSLIFSAGIGKTVPSQDLIITWLPQNISPFITISPMSGALDFNFGTGDHIISGAITDAFGYKQYTIQPPSMTPEEIDANPFLEKANRIDFTISNNDSYESMAFYLIQRNYGAVPTIDMNYLMDGSQHFFTVKSNAQWRIEVTNDPNGIIQELVTTTGGENLDKRDENVYFRTIDDVNSPTLFEGEVTFTLKSTNPNLPFADKSFIVKFYSGQMLGLSNTYIVNTLSTVNMRYLIPVYRANEATPGSIGNEDELEAYFVWTDDVQHVSSVKLATVGKGSSGYIWVSPGNPQANTVIAVKVGGVIKWSWHLWTANFNPLENIKTLGIYQLMDRNLGALNNDVANYYSTGTFYQWGRKDPFPTSAGIASNTNETIYNGSGQSIGLTTSAVGSTLAFTVQNPLTYLINGSSWTGSSGANSWINGGNKTIYDPCPPGWRVPPVAMWSPLNTGNLVWNATNRGANHSTAGWFPAAGGRDKANSLLRVVGTEGIYWSAMYNTPYIQSINFRSGYVVPTTNYFYIEGATIRCIKE